MNQSRRQEDPMPAALGHPRIGEESIEILAESGSIEIVAKAATISRE